MAQPKIPPHSLEAEQSVLGAILIDKNAIVAVAGFLRPEHFYDQKHSTIYSAMLSLYEERKPIDILTLTEKLKAAKGYKEVGGGVYLTELTNIVPTSANVEHYANIIKEDSAKRELISVSGELSQMAFDTSKSLREILDKTERSVFSISQSAMEKNFIPMKEILTQSFDRLEELQTKGGGGLRGIPTGFKDLDNILAGMQGSNLLILASRPGIGKTAFVLNVARHVAIKESQPVGIFSLEMSQEELGDRLLIIQSNVDAFKFKTGRLEDSDFDQLQDAMGLLADAPIYIDDTPGISIMEMRTKARRLQVEKGLRLLIVDYLQLVDPGRRYDNRVQEVSIVSQALKNIARELKVPLLCVSQLNRAVETRSSKKPQLADLRESGSIEQDADVVMFLYRPEEEQEKEQVVLGDKIATELAIAKHRNGACTTINYIFSGPTYHFREVEKRRVQE